MSTATNSTDVESITQQTNEETWNKILQIELNTARKQVTTNRTNKLEIPCVIN